MEDFSTTDIKGALLNRFVVIVGDSNQRNIYKDLVLLLQTDRYLTMKELRTKGEKSFLNDELIEGGCMEKMSNGTNYREVRQYKTDVHLVRFYFVTRCYNAYVESILDDLQQSPIPDIVILNSCLWDITRYGCGSIPDYKANLKTLFTRLTMCLPTNCLIVWNTTLPISSSARSGFLIPEVAFKAARLRLDILEANYYAQMIASKCGFDVLDLHFYLRNQLQMRANDGIHWDMMAHRTISNLILTHIFEAWGIPVPRKQITFGSYGSTHARNGYYQQLGKDIQQQPLLRESVYKLGKDRQRRRLLRQPVQQMVRKRQTLLSQSLQYDENRQPLLQPQSYRYLQTAPYQHMQPQSYQHFQPQIYHPQPYQCWSEDTQLDLFEEWTEDAQLQPQSSQQVSEDRQWQPLQLQPLQSQPVQLQPVQLQTLQMQPLQQPDFNTGVQTYSDSFDFGVGNMTFQNIQVFDPFHWQPYQQSSSFGADAGHSQSRYQPYRHRRHDPSVSSRCGHNY